MRFTVERVAIVKTHYQYGECLAKTVRKLRAMFERNDAPAATTIWRFMQKFEKLAQLPKNHLIKPQFKRNQTLR